MACKILLFHLTIIFPVLWDYTKLIAGKLFCFCIFFVGLLSLFLSTMLGSISLNFIVLFTCNFLSLIYFYLIFIFTFQGELTYGKIGEWRFDKRSYLRGPPPRNLSLPPPGVPESVVCFYKRHYFDNK